MVVSRTPFCTLFILSFFPVKNSYAAQAHFERGQLNTCVGCLPDVCLPPVLAARQKSPPETSAKGKFLTPIDSSGAISYRCYIVTESLSPTIFEIMSIFSILYLGHDLDLSRSRDVIGHMTNRSAICHFLLVSHWNRTSISNRF